MNWKRVAVLRNWGGNLEYQTSEILAPANIESLAQNIKSGKVRPIGTRHSFSKVAIGEGKLVSSSGLAFAPMLDAENSTVTVSAATRYGDLASFLEENNLALVNMGSLPHISIAGAAATATHGSGIKNQILSASLREYSFLDARGKLVTYRLGDENFEACRVGLGAYGLWVSVTLAVVPSYQMRQDIFLNVPWDEFYQDPIGITGAGYSVSLFTKWAQSNIDQIWVKSKISDGNVPTEIGGINPETKSLLELAPGVGDNLTEQGGVPGPWLNRLPHFRLDAEPSAGDEIQTEYFVLSEQAVGAIKALQKIGDQINQTLIISEIRTIAKDDAWLSPMYRGDSVALHFTWINDSQKVDKAVSLVEKALEPFDPIPHWGKVHHLAADRLAKLHPKLESARQVFDALDPEGVFSSDYLVSVGLRS
jgi:xylitol oxidase